MAIRRLKEVVIVAQDVDGALARYRDNLGLEGMGCAEGVEGRVPLGETSLVILSPQAAAERLSNWPGGQEGLASLTLEVDDLEGLVSRLRRAGIEVVGPEEKEGLQVAFLPAEWAYGVPLYLVQKP